MSNLELRKKAWARAIEDHHVLVDRVRNDKTKSTPKSSKSRTLQMCQGSYVLRCDEAAKAFPSSKLCTLDVMGGESSGLVAGYLDLGYFERTMLLSTSEDTLEDFLVNNEDTDEASGGNEDSGSDHCYLSLGVEEAGSDSGHGQSSAQSKKRSASALGASKTQPRGGRVKRIKHGSPGRVSIRLRGREVCDGRIVYEPSKGYLEFTDGTFTEFSGVLGLHEIGSKVKIQGFKVSASAKKEYMPWSTFSEKQFDMQCVATW
ncbi:hypothetical protein BX600DRAFT_441060 [Xylariales sp. PMI_506]|nr:hypothetical protein BX600DRAFT_441060 [Xylariales sp. PMI_506]